MQVMRCSVVTWRWTTACLLACGGVGGEGTAPAPPGFQLDGLDGESDDSGVDGSEEDGGSASSGGSENLPSEFAGAGDAPAASSLRVAADRLGKLVGVALRDDYMRGDLQYAEVARREFNSVTAENEMKWESLERNRGQYDFAPADRIVEFAEQNDMRIKGHTLVWHSQLPAWVEALTDPDEIRQVMLNHIEVVMTRYRGRVAAWDVVNEAWQGGRSPTLRDSVFRVYLGEGFIDEAFVKAREVDPDAQLYYNDFGGEGLGGKANAIYGMVQGMVSRGVPIDGVGLQLHTRIDGGPGVDDFEANLQRIADLGLDVIVSEMDVRSCSSELGDLDQRFEMQRQRFYDLVTVCLNQPRCTELTFWGVTDQYSWLGQCDNGQDALGLLFDGAYQKKPAYQGVLDAFSEAL